jgi:protease-4
MLRRAAASTYWLLLHAFVLVHAAQPPFLEPSPRLSSLLPRESVAAVEGSLATVFNPAALDARREADFTYLRTLDGDLAKDDAFFLALRGVGVGLEYTGAILGGRPVGYRRATFSGGSHLGGGLYWGTLYSTYASRNRDYDDLKRWDVGVLLRRRWLSVGAVGRDVNRPRFQGERVERSFDFGLAVRPGTDRLTFAFDLHKSDDESFRAAWRSRRFFGSVAVEPLEGLQLAGNAYGGGQFEVRAMVSLRTLRVGSHHRLEGGEQRDVVGILNLHQGVRHSAFSRPRYVVIAAPDEWEPVYWRVRRDPRAAGVVLKLNGERYSLARWQEWRDQLAELREKGLSTACYIHETGTGGYYLASGAEMIAVDPLGEIGLLGLRSDSLHFRGTLERLAIAAHFERAGQFKSGPETFTHTAPTDPVVENENAVLDDLYDQVVAAIGEGRRMSPEAVRRAVDAGPYFGRETPAAGLADLAATPARTERIWERQHHPVELVAADEYLDNRPRPTDWGPPQAKLALIRVEGILVDGESVRDPFTGSLLAGAETLGKAIRDAAADPQVKAILLDIESGGGLVSASERLWREVREAGKTKPVVARLGGVAASGAYYVAVAAHRIVAEPMTITGSIGVFSGRFSTEGLLAKGGVSHYPLYRGENADLLSSVAPLSPRHAETLREQVATFYGVFLQRVARGRNMPFERARELAEGRVWTGREAHEKGLVDELGGMREAVMAAKRLARIPEERLLRVEVLPQPSFFERLAGVGRLFGRRRGGAGLLGRAVPQEEAAALWAILSRPRVLAWSPFTVSD